MIFPISDGRYIRVENPEGNEHPIVMVQPGIDGRECVICYMTGPVSFAITEAERIVKGIEFDIRWMAGVR